MALTLLYLSLKLGKYCVTAPETLNTIHNKIAYM